MSKTHTAFLVAGTTLTALVTAGAANAANYRRDNWFWNYHNERWCLSAQEVQATDCAYPTFAQCNYSRNGVGGTCSENPRYVDRLEPRKRAKRAYR